MSKGGIPLPEWSGSGALDELHATIRNFNERASAQTDQMIRLTKATVGLTVVLLTGLVVQIILAL